MVFFGQKRKLSKAWIITFTLTRFDGNKLKKKYFQHVSDMFQTQTQAAELV